MAAPSPSPAPERSGRSPLGPLLTPSGGLTAVLVAVLLAVNGFAVWGMVAARQSAERSARDELALATSAHAKALEAALATLYGDFVFLSYAPPLSRAPSALAGEDPTSRRWSRLAIEGALILFLEAHPSVARVRVLDHDGSPLVVAGWRGGMPVLLPSVELTDGLDPAHGLVAVRWPLGAQLDGRASLEALIDPDHLLTQVAPGLGDRLRVLPHAAPGDSPDQRPTPSPTASDTGLGEGPGAAPEAMATTTLEGSGDVLVARAPVVDPRFDPPIRWHLERRESTSRLLRSVEDLADRYRTTVAVNLSVMLLTLLLGLLALRQVRRTARLEAENRHQARVRELELQLQQNERLASLGRLATGVAHEINNPLEGMANYLTLLEEDLEAGDTASARTMAPKVREGLVRIAAIVRQVLTFGGRGASPAEAVALGEVLRRTVDFVRDDPAFAPLAIELHLDPPPGLRVLGDPGRLGQLFLNLLLNAAQMQTERYGQEGIAGADGAPARDPATGSPIDRARIEVAATSRGDQVTVTVADRGPGLTAEAARHLFEPFYSTRGSTGLGLAVCHGIAADHGGSIRAENRAGGGALLTVTLPRLAAPEPGETGAAGETDPPR